MFAEAGLMFKKMIIAKLGGNDQYEQMCEAMRKYILDTDVGKEETQIYLGVWSKLCERLKSVTSLEKPEMD